MFDKILGLVLSSIGVAVFGYLIFFLRRIYVESRENNIREIDLTGQKIKQDDDTRDLNSLVDDLNKDLGSDDSGDKKG